MGRELERMRWLRRLQVGLYAVHVVVLVLWILAIIATRKWFIVPVSASLYAYWLYRTARKIQGHDSLLRRPLSDLVPVTISYHGMRRRERLVFVSLGVLTTAQLLFITISDAWYLAVIGVSAVLLLVLAILAPNALAFLMVLKVTADDRRTGEHSLLIVVIAGFLAVQFLGFSLLPAYQLHDSGFLILWIIIVTGVLKDRLLFLNTALASTRANSDLDVECYMHEHAREESDKQWKIPTR